MSKRLFLKQFELVAVVGSNKCPGSKITTEQRRSFIVQHNRLRSKLIHGKLTNKNGKHMPSGKNMMKMVWSCTLEKAAQLWAERCVMKHSERDGKTGENLYFWSSSNTIPKEELRTAGVFSSKDWWSELPELYRNNPKNILTDKVWEQGIGHFTQMAWGKTYKIGCGIASHCDGGKAVYVVCQYRPRGNMIGELIYELGKPCKTDGDCRTKKCHVKSGLCEK
uniref:SCP domain-containing protein n=1 Tax=Setaria digitata TaxID=48799 RepID=A0A915PDL3_9BILA